MYSIQNVFSTITNAMFFGGISTLSFRVNPHSETRDVIFGPACWSIHDIAHKVWLVKHGFSNEDIDKIGTILHRATYTNENTVFLEQMNAKLFEVRVQLGLDHLEWTAKELRRLRDIDGFGFIKASNLSAALMLWHHLQFPIEVNDSFHERWKYISAKDQSALFNASYIHWKLSTMKNSCNKDIIVCLKRYGIILDNISI